MSSSWGVMPPWCPTRWAPIPSGRITVPGVLTGRRLGNPRVRDEVPPTPSCPSTSQSGQCLFRGTARLTSHEESLASFSKRCKGRGCCPRGVAVLHTSRGRPTV